MMLKIWNWLKNFYHKMGSPKWFYDISGRWLPWLTAVSVLLIGVAVVWGLVFAPEDFRQGNSYRIIFIHVPAAFLAQFGYILMAVAGIVSLVWKMKMADVALKCTAPIGASFCFIALVTGAIWGKPTWGAWWVWDARLTSMLILLFLYLGVIALQSAIENRITAAKAGAILSIVGVINIPIIKYSVEWWNTLHQPATLKITEKSTMAPEMLIPLLLSVFGFYCLFTLMLLMRMRNDILENERRTRWVRNILMEQT